MKNFLDKVQKVISSKAFMLSLSFVGLFLVSTGVSVAVFSFVLKTPSSIISPGGIEGKRPKIDSSLPKTEACPTNGAMFTKAERDIWEGRRPITAVIENHANSKPQAGLSRADVIYEAVAEGGITRFLVIFYCGVAAEDVGIRPIRSARFYYINWATEYGNRPLFVHQGGANSICNNCPGGVKPKGTVDPSVDIYKLLDKIGWSNGKYGNDMDGQTNLGFPAISRVEWKADIAWEHRVTGSTDLLYEEGADRGFAAKDPEGVAWDDKFIPWKFTDDKPLGSPVASNISFEFWSNKSDYNVEWKYNQADNLYKRFNGGVEHVDYNNKEQLSAKNIVVMFVKEKGPVDKEGHMFYTVTGSGPIKVFQNGDVIEGTWEKATIFDRTKFSDKSGKEISFVRGTIWIEAVPAGNEINY